MSALATLKVFHHARAGRVCVYQPIPPSGRLTWCTRSDLNGCWMPCANPHPQGDVIDVPVNPAQPTQSWQRTDVEPDQDLINAATVIKRAATRTNRHPQTAAILLPIADDLRRRALVARDLVATEHEEPATVALFEVMRARGWGCCDDPRCPWDWHDARELAETAQKAQL